MAKKKRLHKMQMGVCIFCSQGIADIKSEVCGLKPKKRVNVNKVLLKAADDLFSMVVRAESGWRCIKCGSKFNVAASLKTMNGRPLFRSDAWGESKNLHASHFFPRANFNTRWDRFNVWAQCGGMRPGGKGRWVMTGCHADCEVPKSDARAWYENYIIGKIGTARFLMMEAFSHRKSVGHDKEMIILEQYKTLMNMGYGMEWFKKSHQKHLKINLEAAP